MTSPDDDQLKTFLRQYRPEPPPAPVALEDEVMAAITAANSSSFQRNILNRGQLRRAKLFWLPVALAAGLGLVWMGDRWLSPPQTLTATEIQELESFLEHTWSGILEDPVAPDPLFDL